MDVDRYYAFLGTTPQSTTWSLAGAGRTVAQAWAAAETFLGHNTAREGNVVVITRAAAVRHSQFRRALEAVPAAQRRVMRVAVYLPLNALAWLQRCGGGNASAGLRAVLSADHDWEYEEYEK